MITYLSRQGSTLATKDGVSIIVMPSKFKLPDDITEPTLVPGLSKDMEVLTVGDYTADFYGVQYAGENIVTWSLCCKAA